MNTHEIPTVEPICYLTSSFKDIQYWRLYLNWVCLFHVIRQI